LLASFTQATWTCFGVTPAASRRCNATVHGRASGGAHSAMAWPPCAQSTIVTRADLAGEASARRLKVENSWVAFDMLIETKTMRPSAAWLPPASSG
jgi:hypothetical protein